MSDAKYKRLRSTTTYLGLLQNFFRRNGLLSDCGLCGGSLLAVCASHGLFVDFLVDFFVCLLVCGFSHGEISGKCET